MTYKPLQQLAVFALSVGLVGCMVPKPLGGVGVPARVAADRVPAALGSGTVEVNVVWPNSDGGYRTQAIPNRAAFAVVTLTAASGSAPLDKNNALINPVTINRNGSTVSQGGTATGGASGSPAPAPSAYPSPGPNGGYGAPPASQLAWALQQQAGLNIKAELFDAASNSIGLATQSIDVIAGYHSVVGLDIVIKDAPAIDSVSPTTFKIGDQVIITGRNFGLSHKDWSAARVFLYSKGSYSWGNSGGPGPNQYWNQVYLPAAKVSIVSDTQLSVTIPPYLDNGWQFVDSLWNYFHSTGNQQLYLGVMVDGINSNPIPVTIPKTASDSITVNLQQGTDAPAHQASASTVLDVTAAPYLVPTATGSQWTYAITDSNGTYGYGSRMATLTLSDGQGTANVTYSGQYNYSSNGTVYLQWDWQYGLFRKINAAQGSSIQTFPDESVSLPDGTTQVAKHVFYTVQTGPGASTVREVWYVPNVGPTHIRDVSVYQGWQGMPGSNPVPQRQVHDYRLIGFGQATASATASSSLTATSSPKI